MQFLSFRSLVFLLLILLQAGNSIAMQLAGAPEQPSPTGNSHAVVLQYHHVSNETPRSTSISPEDFSRQMDMISEQGFTVLPLPEVIRKLKKHKPLPERTAVITFDDAYKSVYTAAFPVLEDKGFPFTVFLSTKPVLEKPGKHFLSWPEIIEMQEAGASFGNHTISHAHLIRRNSGEDVNEWKQRIKQEILLAEENIRSHTGITNKLLAYPFGEYNEEIKRLVSDLGFTAFGQHSGAIGPDSDFQALPRFSFSFAFTDQQAFLDKLYSLPMPVVNTMPEVHEITDNNPPVIEIHIQQEYFPLDGFRCFASRQGAMNVKQIKGGYRIEGNGPFGEGRSRYNCTAKSGRTISGKEKSGYSGSRFFWYSIPFYKRKDDGSWYTE